MKLFNAAESPNCMRVRAVLHELGLEADLIDVSIGARVKPPELLAVNPNGKVPVLVEDDGFALWESRAINMYLASKRPERDLYPSDTVTIVLPIAP